MPYRDEELRREQFLAEHQAAMPSFRDAITRYVFGHLVKMSPAELAKVPASTAAAWMLALSMTEDWPPSSG